MNSGQLGGDKEKRAASPISRGPTLIAMMQTADLGEGNNVARGGKLHATRPWAVLVEREMRAGVMMISKIARQYATQVTLAEDDIAVAEIEALGARVLWRRWMCRTLMRCVRCWRRLGI